MTQTGITNLIVGTFERLRDNQIEAAKSRALSSGLVEEGVTLYSVIRRSPNGLFGRRAIETDILGLKEGSVLYKAGEEVRRIPLEVLTDTEKLEAKRRSAKSFEDFLRNPRPHAAFNRGRSTPIFEEYDGALGDDDGNYLFLSACMGNGAYSHIRNQGFGYCTARVYKRDSGLQVIEFIGVKQPDPGNFLGLGKKPGEICHFTLSQSDQDMNYDMSDPEFLTTTEGFEGFMRYLN